MSDILAGGRAGGGKRPAPSPTTPRGAAQCGSAPPGTRRRVGAAGTRRVPPGFPCVSERPWQPRAAGGAGVCPAGCEGGGAPRSVPSGCRGTGFEKPKPKGKRKKSLRGLREYYSVTASVRETEGRTRCCRVCAVSQSPAVCAADCRWGRWPFCVVFVCFCLGRLSFKTCLLTLWSLLTWGKKPPQQGALTCDIRAWREWRSAFPQPEHLNLPEVPWRHSHKQRQPG